MPQAKHCLHQTWNEQCKGCEEFKVNQKEFYFSLRFMQGHVTPEQIHHSTLMAEKRM